VISATPRRNETANIDEPLEYIRYLKFPRLTLDKRVISAATLFLRMTSSALPYRESLSEPFASGILDISLTIVISLIVL